MAVPWLPNFPSTSSAWQESRDDGVSYNPAPAPASSTQAAGPTGQQRFRAVFASAATRPWTVTVSGDIYDGDVNQPAHLYYDGVDMGPVLPLTGPTTFTLPAGGGVHTIELWIGQANDNGGLTIPVMTFNQATPCDCCPAGEVTRCGLVEVAFTAVQQTVAQAGWNPGSLLATINGNTGGEINGYNTSVAGPSTTLRVEYTVPNLNRIRGLRVWNQGGSDLNDADGLAGWVSEWYAGATLLATQVCTAGNGGAPFTNLLPSGQELNGVTRMVMRNLDQIGHAPGVKPLWREIRMLQNVPAYPCRRRSSNVLEWYGPDGAQIAAADLVPCFEGCAVPYVAPTLHMAGAAFNDAANEFVCNVAPPPSASSDWTAAAGNCFDPAVANPTMDWTSVSSVEMEYGSAAGVSGGVIVQFSVPGFPAITWPVGLVQMEPGDTVDSDLFGGGHRARLTYVSGPPSNSPSGTVRTEGGANIGLHRLAVSTVAPIRFRIELFTETC